MTMKKLTPNDPEMQSTDLLGENIARLKALFPEAFTEGRIDFAVLKELLGGHVDEREEKYGLNWHGKRQARRLALTPSTGTLRPCPTESVDWETTQNLIIEGDNLEVLKLLQKSYAGRVKLIYIDPPYNTGKDFVYPDDYRDNIKNYLELTGQVDGEGRRMSSNTEASGRFHTDWLNMMYPRLRLAHNLLQDDGVIVISIDDNEIQRLRMVCDDLFGEENFAGTILWKKKTNGNNMGIIPPVHDYLVCYGKRLQNTSILGIPMSNKEISADYSNPDNDPRGDWNTSDLSANHKGPHFPITNPVTGEIHFPPNGRYWVFNEKEVLSRIADGRIIFGKSGTTKPVQKKFLSERSSLRKRVESWWDSHGYNEEGTAEIGQLMTTKIFDHSKPSRLMRNIVEMSTMDNDLIVDFFAGSGTTAHAVLDLNKQDGGNRRFILVQLPEPTGQKEYPTIAEITKERIRRVIKKLNAEESGLLDLNDKAKQDRGFRVFKLDASNLKPWDPNPADLNRTLLDHVDHILPDRSEQDLLFELLLKLGLELTVPMETRTIAGKQVHAIGGGALLVCLAEKITRKELEPLAQGILDWRRELATAVSTTFVFRDSAFDDVAKTNLAAILEQNLPASALAGMRSL
ncbi:MAG: site-specific DNA-methyltransferase [Magnetococcus sp. THC-1_WYH]